MNASGALNIDLVSGGFPLQEGGGVNPSIQPGWQCELNGYWDDDFKNALDHLSPEAGGIYVRINIFIVLIVFVFTYTFRVLLFNSSIRIV